MNGEFLPFETVPNFRELGGYTSEDGRKIKNGLFYRSATLDTLLTNEHDMNLFNSLGIKAIFDFRSKMEKDHRPDPNFDNIKVYQVSAILDKDGNEVNLDLSKFLEYMATHANEMTKELYENYSLLPFNNKAFQNMFNEIKCGTLPILFHCTAGKDRTGVAGFLIMKLLDIPEDQIFSDYLLTNKSAPAAVEGLRKMFGEKVDHEAKEAIEIMTTVKKEYLQKTIDAILNKYSSFDEFFEVEYGITPELKKKIKDMCLE